MIKPDDLGELGEARFMGLCASAGLICNKSTRDRAGWDFIVESHFDDAAPMTLDRRMAPLSCYIQVKTIGDKKTTVRLKLNMAERLAKEMKPCFICVFKVNEKDEFTDLFLIHVYGDRLSKILKRLRVEEKRKTKRNNLGEIFISFTPMPSERIEMSGSALRLCLEKSSDNDINKYVKEKIFQLQSLGFENSAYKVKVTMEVSGIDEAADIFLGLKERVRIKRFDASETRFGIELVDPTIYTSELTFRPNALDGCTLSIRDRDNGNPSILKAELFVTPPLMNGRRAYFIKGEWISIKAKYEGENAIFEFSINVSGKLLTPSAWSDYFRVMNAIKFNRAIIEIRPDNYDSYIEIPVMATDASSLDVMPDYDQLVDICDRFVRIIKFAGVLDAHEFEFNDIEDAVEEILFVSTLVDGEAIDLNFDVGGENINGIPDHPVIFANRIIVGSLIFDYYAMVIVRREEVGAKQFINLSDFKLKKLRQSGNNLDSFNKFAKNAQEIEGIEFMLRGPLSN